MSDTNKLILDDVEYNTEEFTENETELLQRIKRNQNKEKELIFDIEMLRTARQYLTLQLKQSLENKEK
jgi:hypothetical protein